MTPMSFNRVGSVLLFLLCSPPFLSAQVSNTQVSLASLGVPLPDAPTPVASIAEAPSEIPGNVSGESSAFSPLASSKVGPRRGDPKTLSADQVAIPLSAADKIKLSLLEQVTPFAFASDALAAGWGQLLDSDPRYGSNSDAYRQRIGAAAILHASQGLFSDGVFAAALHQDPRYYRLGNGPKKRRFLYALSRTWETRSDSGSPQINSSLFLGHGAAAALTAAYYPTASVTAPRIAAGYGLSLVGNMMGNEYHEFWPDIADKVFHTKATASQ